MQRKRLYKVKYYKKQGKLMRACHYIIAYSEDEARKVAAEKPAPKRSVRYEIADVTMRNIW